MEQELKYLGEALDQPKRPVRRGARWRQDLRQDRPHRGAAAQGGRDPHRRRHGVHLLPRDGTRDGQLAGGGGARRHGARPHAEGGEEAGAAERCGDRAEAGGGCGDPGGAARPDPRRLGDVRHRSRHRGRLSHAGSSRPARSCGTGRWGCSRRRPSITARWRWRGRWPTRPEGRGHGGRWRRLGGRSGSCGTRGQDDARVDRRRAPHSNSSRARCCPGVAALDDA